MTGCGLIMFDGADIGVANGVRYVFEVFVIAPGLCIRRTILGACCCCEEFPLLPKSFTGDKFWIMCTATDSEVVG